MKKEKPVVKEKDVVLKTKEKTIKEDKKKDIKKDNKKVEPKKKPKEKKEKTSIFKRISNFFKSVLKEVKHVSWPTKKDMFNYSVATIMFVIFFGIFFYLIELLMAFLRTLV